MGCLQVIKIWWTWSGSNRRPLPCHGSALPAAPQAHVEKTARCAGNLSNSILAYPLLLVKPRKQIAHLCKAANFAKLGKLSILMNACGNAWAKLLMRRNFLSRFRCLSVLPLCLAVSAQIASSNQPAAQGPVSYSSVNQLNAMLSQLEQASQTTQVDLAKMRIDKWKVDSGSKRQTQGNVESVQRNLQSALPEIIAQLKASPENLAATFKLYRNLDALYNVFGSVTESTGAFGSKDEFQSLENDLGEVEKARRAFADRMETLAGAKEAEMTRCARRCRAHRPALRPSLRRKSWWTTQPHPKSLPPRRRKPLPNQLPLPPHRRLTTPRAQTAVVEPCRVNALAEILCALCVLRVKVLCPSV